MGVIAGQIFSRATLSGFGNVRAQFEFVWIKHGAIARGSSFVRVVRRTPGEKEQKWFVGSLNVRRTRIGIMNLSAAGLRHSRGPRFMEIGVGAKKLLGIARLGDGVVALPL